MSEKFHLPEPPRHKPREPMFLLNPALPMKTYEVFGANGQKIGNVNDDNVHAAFHQARAMFGQRARFVALKSIPR